MSREQAARLATCWAIAERKRCVHIVPAVRFFNERLVRIGARLESEFWSRLFSRRESRRRLPSSISKPHALFQHIFVSRPQIKNRYRTSVERKYRVARTSLELLHLSGMNGTDTPLDPSLAGLDDKEVANDEDEDGGNDEDLDSPRCSSKADLRLV